MLAHGIAQQLSRLGQRSFRWALLLVVACFLGLSGHSHLHAAERSRATVVQDVQAEPSWVAAHAEETCAICVWKAHNPLAPGSLPSADVTALSDLERSALQPRAPPVLALVFRRNRAPPALLS